MPWQMQPGAELYLELAFFADVSKGQRLLVAKPAAEVP